MAGYAEELRRKDGSAVAARYHPDGAWRVVDGHQAFYTAAALRERYETKWRGPDHFAWRELAYEVTGSDSVVVIGSFDWSAGGPPGAMTYLAVLRRHDGWLRISHEAETTVRIPPA